MLLGIALFVSLVFNYHFLRLLRAPREPSEEQPDRPTPKPDSLRPPEEPTPKPTKPTFPEARHTFDNSLISFVRLDRDIASEISLLEDSGQLAESLVELRQLLHQALNDCGIRRFQPSIGESYRTAFGVAPRPKIIPTSEQEKDWSIAKIVEPGFYFEHESDERQCLQEAVVHVYKFTSQEKDS